MTEAEIAWAAGLFEGEGSLVQTHRKSIRLQLQTTDLDVLQRFAAIVDAGAIHRSVGDRIPPRKPIHAWMCGRRSDVERLKDLFWPWLGERRRLRWKELLELREVYEEESTRPRACRGCSTPIAPSFSTQSGRQAWCSPACRDRNRVRLGLR